MAQEDRVVIGLPVFNGEKYLAEAIEAILSQTYTNLNLVISDNASKDTTEDICREFAKRDARVHYVRQSSNIGASANFNAVFSLAQEKYFKWAAHDDLIAPTYLERCVDLLARHPDAVLCQSLVRVVDDAGRCLELYDHASLGTGDPDRIRRFRARLNARRCMEVFGVIRSDVLRETELIAPFVGADRTLLLDLALHGRFLLVPDYLFVNRDHALRISRALRASDQLQWYAPERAGRPSLRTWNLIRGGVRLLNRRVDGRLERLRGYVALFQSLSRHRRWLKLPLEILGVFWPQAPRLEDRLVNLYGRFKLVRRRVASAPPSR